MLHYLAIVNMSQRAYREIQGLLRMLSLIVGDAMSCRDEVFGLRMSTVAIMGVNEGKKV